MSDSENPMEKMRHSEPDDQSFDDVQEEWLNEDVLSDDEFNSLDHDSTEQNESLNMDLGLASDDASLTAKHSVRDVKEDLSEKIDTIDEYLDQFMDDDKETQMESWQTGKEPVQNSTSAVDFDDGKHSDDSTDELLRLLGEDEKTSKPKVTVVKSAKSVVEVKEMVSSENEIFEGAKIRAVKLSKNVLMKKSVPEVKHETSDSEVSDDKLMRRIFRPTKKLQKAAKSTTKSSLPQKLSTVAPPKVISSPQSGLSKKPSTPAPPKVTSAPRKPVTVAKKRSRTATVRKPVTTTTAASARKATPAPTKLEPEAVKIEEDLKPVVQKLGIHKNMVVADEKSLKMLLEKTEDEESWDDENLEYLDGEFDEETSDEEVVKKMKLSNDDMTLDHDSEDSDYSYYEGMPTSESEDIEECFELDIRAERAADYVPMLGGAAHKLLTGEKNRVTMKLNELRKVLAQIIESVKEQTTEIDAARKKLRELNMQLNHT